MSDADGFLARWSRRKAQIQDGAALPDEPPPAEATVPEVARPAPPPAAAALPATPVDRAPAEPPAPLPTMDDVALLTRSSDYSRFVAPGIDSGVSNAAMKKLFTDPHFNVMDGLDTYIDDYGKPDPIPEAMLRRMVQAKSLGLFEAAEEAVAPAPPAANDAVALPALNEEARADALVASTDGAAAAPLSQSAPNPDGGAPAGAPEDPCHDDPDLRLQQDDAAGRPGAAEGARP